MIAWLIAVWNCRPQEQPPLKPLDRYTAEDPGNLADYKDSHLPQVEVLHEEAEEKQIRITVPLSNASLRHYIEVIGVMKEKDGRSTVIARKPFQRGAKEFVAVFTVPRQDHLEAFAKCNIHHLWVAPVP